MDKKLEKLIDLYDKHIEGGLFFAPFNIDMLRKKREQDYKTLVDCNESEILKECGAFNRYLLNALLYQGVSHITFGRILGLIMSNYVVAEPYLSYDGKIKAIDNSLENIQTAKKIFKRNPNRNKYKIGAIKNATTSLNIAKQELPQDVLPE